MSEFLYKYDSVISNMPVDSAKLDFAKKVISELHVETATNMNEGCGPFRAALYDGYNNLIAKCSNSVVTNNCSNEHAEMNAIKLAELKLGTYDLSPYNLSLYVTSEPCMMCIGAILWSGIKAVYYGVPTGDVEEITGYDEGFKPDLFKQFAQRDILVCGNIESDLGKKVLSDYVKSGNVLYKPAR